MRSRKKCPKGSISRKSYTYVKKSTGKKIHVKSTCVKSKGLRSKGLKPVLAIRKSSRKSKKSSRKSTRKSKKSSRKSTKKSSRKSTKKSSRKSTRKSKKSKKSSRKSTKKSKKSTRKSTRKSKKSRKSRKSKKLDNGDFSDTGRYNINERAIKEYPRTVLIQKYTELIDFLGLRKRQLQLYNRSTFRIDMQLKAAMAERLYLVKNQKWNQKILIGLNNMP